MRQLSQQQATVMLEHIHYWKRQEKEHAYFVRWALPSLAAPLKKLMQQWEQHFALTAHRALELWRAVRRDKTLGDQFQQNLIAFSDYTDQQSREWIRHLIRMTADSKVIQNSNAARQFIDHLIRESDYYLRGLLSIQEKRQLMATPKEQRPISSHEERQHLASTEEQQHLASPIPTAFPIKQHHGKVAERHSEHNNEPYSYQHRSIVQPRSITLTKTNEGTWTMQSSSTAFQIVHAESQQTPVPQQKPDASLTLPELPFALNALEPYLSTSIVKNHYWGICGEIIRRYDQVKQQLNYAMLRGDEMNIRYWQQKAERLETLHELHRLYWNAIDPNGGGAPSGPIANQLETDFGTFQQFREQFTSFAMQEDVGGWIILAWNPASYRLVIHSMQINAPYSQWQVIPLLVLDMEEHAYMLQYKTNRQEYIEAWWSLINWNRINERFVHARRLKHYPL